jgi:hypothetical protein
MHTYNQMAGKIFDILTTISSSAASWLFQNFISPFIAFAKGFEFAVLVLACSIFLLITVIVLVRQARKLPKSYEIQIRDVFGYEDQNRDLRQSFQTYEAAESYARQYTKLYGRSLKFKVVGVR